MKYAKELAPNLFDSFEDWYENYINTTAMEPDDFIKESAIEYFQERRMLHIEEDYIYET